MRSLARWGSLPLVAMPLNSWALGLGEIESNSFLNQPLNAEIALSATEEELATLRVSLAPVDAFLQQGLEYPSFLNSVQFDITQNSGGENVIVVTSTQSIAEPFVTFLVQATHARGGITREYSVLLDPPLFLPPAAETPQISAPVALEPAPEVAGGPIERAPEPVEPVAVQPVAVEPAVTPEISSQSEPASPVAATGTDYTVQGGDTLWGIASSVRPAGVTINQAMLSIFEANPSAFEGNINRLRRGAILRIPPSSALGGLTAAAATAEVQRQFDIWRNAVEATPQLVLLPPGDDVLAGGAAGSGNPAAVNALEGQVTNLEAELAATEAELVETRRLLELRSGELAELQTRLGDGSATELAPEAVAPDGALADDPLAGLESEPLFVDDLEPEAAIDAGLDEAPVPQVADSSTADTEPAQSASTTSSAPVVFAESEPSLIARVLGFLTQPIVMIAGGVIVVVLAALAFLRRRRDGSADDVTGQWKKLESEMDEEFDGSSTTQLDQLDDGPDMVVVEGGAETDATDPEFGATAAIEALGSDLDELDASLPGTEAIEALTDEDLEGEDGFLDIGTATTADAEGDADATADADAEEEPALADQTMSSQTIINLDQADPIAEADFHMAYGLYDQAADLISKALAAEPENRELKLKLLEVYFVWGNKEEFLATATGLREEIGTGGNVDWDKVVIMGKQICPDETLFSQATAAAPEVDLALEASGVTTGLDFAFEEDDASELDLDIVEEDYAAPEETSLAGAEAGVSDAPAEDASEFLDIGERTQAGLKAAFFEDIADDDAASAPDVDDVDIESAIGEGGSEDTALEAELEDIDEIEVTQEAPAFDGESEDFADFPTLEAPTVEAELGAPTLAAPGMDSPTVETPAMDEATVEAPAFDPDAIEDIEDIEIAEAEDVEAEAAATGEISSVRLAAGGGGADMTAEIEIDDLGLDVGDVSEFEDLEVADDPGGTEAFADLTVEQPEADDPDQLSATGVTKVLDQPDAEIDATVAAEIGDDEATVMAPGFDIEATGTTTEVLEQSVADFDPDEPASADDLNFDDFSTALEGADTVERPASAEFGTGRATSADSSDGSVSELTGTTEIGPIDPQAMSEVGTKLDLARAYIDMGDPEGARSILEEVLTEGNDKQKSEAQTLLDSL